MKKYLVLILFLIFNFNSNSIAQELKNCVFGKNTLDFVIDKTKKLQEELDKIAKGIESLEEKKAETVGGGKDDVRSSKVRWIPQNENWWWLYEKLHDMAVEANNCLWKFDLTSLSEKIQYTEYHAEEGGHYTWHQDIGPGDMSVRKI